MGGRDRCFAKPDKGPWRTTIMAGNFFRGTSVEQDGRWGKSDEKLMAKMAKSGLFSPILETKVNTKKVNLDVINKWITQKIIEVVGFEDDILINLVINMLQGNNLDGKKMQLDVTGFLEKQAGAFMEELWNLLVDAQSQPSGIPSSFLKRKKEEILSRQQAQGSRWGTAAGKFCWPSLHEMLCFMYSYAYSSTGSG
jgi:serine/arginine repetitive matrix protein 1